LGVEEATESDIEPTGKRRRSDIEATGRDIETTGNDVGGWLRGWVREKTFFVGALHPDAF